MPPLDEPHHTTTSPAPTPHPPSPAALAAAAALAALADSRPPTSYGEDEDEADHDDHSGSASLADFQHFFESSSSGAHLLHGDVATAPSAAMSQYHSWPHAASHLDVDLLEPYHISNVHIPPHPAFIAHLSSSDPFLDPPPLHEAQISVQSKAAFMPITDFFQYHMAPPRPTIRGLDHINIPPVISRDQLQGDHYDCQGIDWTSRNVTRSTVRAKRYEHEFQRLHLSQRELRKVCQLRRLDLRPTNSP